ncbi:MAG: NAD(P)-dependent oxidoreductase [Deltaproteobacteria bacterium]|nr:NAD(P)-dependent oxidoreductase [Deltaproteobacteria bacterium]
MAKKYTSVVTGACGFIGSHMVDFAFSNLRLKAAGYELKHPDPKAPMVEVAKWFDERGLL